MTSANKPAPPALNPLKFRDPDVTADGSRRAAVGLTQLKTLWFLTGSLCNLTCEHCYVESSPRNDRLAYLNLSDVTAYLDEIARDGLPTEEIGFTGGEPFMNPEIVPILESCLARGFRVLVLTNAMTPLKNRRAAMLELNEKYGAQLVIRVSLDHYSATLHEMERGKATWARTIDGVAWLARNGFELHVAGRTCWQESEDQLRRGYEKLFAAHAIDIDARDPARLVLFPEMDEVIDVPEITTACWDILGVSPDSIMCATSRMVVKRKGADRAAVVPCTLLPYDTQFEMGHTLREAAAEVKLNHPHCSSFCVLGGGSCSKS